MPRPPGSSTRRQRMIHSDVPVDRPHPAEYLQGDSRPDADDEVTPQKPRPHSKLTRQILSHLTPTGKLRRKS